MHRFIAAFLLATAQPTPAATLYELYGAVDEAGNDERNDGRAELIRELVARGFPDAAVSEAVTAIKSDPQNSGEFVDIVVELSGKHGDMGVLDDIAPKLAPPFKTANAGVLRYARAAVHLSAREDELAMAELEAAPQGAPGYAECRFLLGRVHHSHGKLKSAVKGYRDAVQNPDPDWYWSAEGLFWIARVYYGLDRPTNALGYYDMDGLLQHTHLRDDAGVEGGWALVALGQPADAARRMRPYLEGPRAAEAHLVAAVAEGARGRTKRQNDHIAAARALVDAALAEIPPAEGGRDEELVPMAVDGTYPPQLAPWLGPDRFLDQMIDHARSLAKQGELLEKSHYSERVQARVKPLLAAAKAANDERIAHRARQRLAVARDYNERVRDALSAVEAGTFSRPTELDWEL